ncbi:MAG: hypothetical protein QOJ89_410 [bacterium]|jgi:ABC-type amino acid transport substrate-binding protein
MAHVSSPARRAATAAALACATLAACGGQDVVVEQAPTPRERGVAPAAGGTTAADPLRAGTHAASTLQITVDDTDPGRFAYRAPRVVRGGLVEIRLRNVGDAPHKAQLWRIAGDHSVAQALKISHPQPGWQRAAGGVSLTAPKTTSTTLQALPAGRYYVAGTLDQPGRVATFRVTGPAAAPEPPKAPARVQALDFSFRVSGLHAGRNSVDFDNTGTQPHHAFFAPMRPDANLADVRKFFGERTSVGRPPVGDATRETVVLEGGERQVTQLNLSAGRYALICFVRSRGGGPRHLELGMINEVTVR